MCGRYFVDEAFEEILRRYKIHDVPDVNWSPREVFPTNEAPVVINAKEEYRAGLMKWGFVFPNMSRPIINARSETAGVKPAFKEALLKRRCIVPASGFFEWHGEKGARTKFRIERPEKSLVSFAGLYAPFTGTDGTRFFAYVILTRQSSPPVSEIHDREPIILKVEEEDVWLSQETTPGEIEILMRQTGPAVMLNAV
ncbi:SOS response-associated peptidase [Acidaminobacter hydrogenoformans]|uniref:Abasic site processing protein n=1 Tax=Acidaminobacter hydrogenoformans DSM 2784 TaxID=1120920 RepID=A0A1G5RX39_9FIRM|nr:SOS response-associated peptidase [Acidaminobacter hydrogenoformans]SCZ78428.1 Putative SOS response-associated peptidase YedK [Acidaminobacter hydrogenoformans DSM 2784]